MSTIFDMYMQEAYMEDYVYEGEYINLNECGELINEDADDVISTVAGITLTAAAAAITVIATALVIKSAKETSELKAALKKYESDNEDLIPLQDFDKKLYKINLMKKEVTDKEDKESEIFKKLLGPSLYDKMRRNKANRFVEYSKNGKFQIGVMYTVESWSDGVYQHTHSTCSVSFAKNSDTNVLKHKEYYINKILIEHGMASKNYKKFIESTNSLQIKGV